MKGTLRRSLFKDNRTVQDHRKNPAKCQANVIVSSEVRLQMSTNASVCGLGDFGSKTCPTRVKHTNVKMRY